MSTNSVSAPSLNAQSSNTERAPLFSLGHVVATPAALDLLEKYGENSSTLLHRHQSGDWGDLDASDQSANKAALKDGSRLLSSYALGKSDKIWVLTEAVGEDGVSRASTCILLPGDY